MKTTMCVLFAASAMAAAAADGAGEESPSGWKIDAGADVRVRQEIMHNVPGLPGAPGAMMPRAYKKNINHIRVRPRGWVRLDGGDFTFYARLADEIREHVVENGVPRKLRSYNFPDEVVVDNLYFAGTGLFDGFMDFKLGRQDLFDGRTSTLGLERIMFDGAPYVGSRSCYADMARVTLHPSEASKLDAFLLYDNGRNVMRYGSRHSRGRPMNAIHPADSPEMDEWGGGLVWNDVLRLGDSEEGAYGLPYQLFAVHKHTESYTTVRGERMQDKQITTLGFNLKPEFGDNLAFELEGAKQVGSKSNGTQAGGWMAYAAADVHKSKRSEGWRPWGRLSLYYLSGDRRRTGAHDNDTAWDPMWARAPNDSELMQYGTLYGLGYWSNMIHPKLAGGVEFGRMHRLAATCGPMFAAAQDRLGHADGSGRSMYKGLLSTLRYDFPIRLAPKGATGLDRFSVFGHLLAEFFNPGDYYDTSRPSYFLRWEVTVRF